MKNLGISVSVFMIALLTCFTTLTAQRTYHFDLHAEVNNVPMLCGNHIVSGSWTYNFHYRLDKQGNLIDMHWNLKHCDLRDSQTGEKYKVIDSGKDDLGALWWMFNNLNALNEPYDVQYNVEDGWLDDVMPANLPDEGRLVSMSFKFIAKKGVVYKWSTLWLVNRNAKGEITASKYKEILDCE